MEVSNFRSLTDLGMEDLLFCQQWSIDSIDELSSVSNMASIFCEDFDHHSYNYNSMINSRQPELKRAPEEWPSRDGGDIVIRPSKQLKSENKPNSLVPPNHTTYNTPLISHVGTVSKKPKEEISWYSSTTSTTITFGQQNCDVPKSCEDAKSTIINTNSTTSTTTTTATTRVPSAQERMLAERKRREKLTQRFIALSALLPGLKKMDKASVLGDAIKYLKQLEDKVKILEEQKTKKKNVVSVKKYKLDHIADNIENSLSSSDESIPSATGPILPEIGTRLCNKDVLIHIHCERKKGVLEKTVAEIERLNLSVVNSSVITFGESALSISLVAEMDGNFTLEMNRELVKNLNVALSCEK